MSSESEFYVGYLPIPGGLKKVMRRAVVALGITVSAAAVLLVAGQHPFASSKFEFQQYRDFQGVLRTWPYPALAMPGQQPPWLLAGPGKHGVGEAVRGLDGRRVQLKGARVLRESDRMIELLPGSLQVMPDPVAAAGFMELGQTQLTGEIVDSKCYFGVMNPGNGKVHRDCAVRCISGGIPPAFLVRDASGSTMTLLLANWRRDLLDHVAEPVTIRGRLVRSGGRLILYAE